MRSLRLVATAVAAMAAVLVLIATAAPAGALAVTAPLSTNLGSVPAGSSRISAQLGAVTVTATGLVAPSFKATVSATVFTTGSGGAGQTIGKESIFYWSGQATATTGVTVTPGQPTEADAVDLTVPRTAFSGKGVALTISAAWNPTLIIIIPASAVAGTYTATITHSVA